MSIDHNLAERIDVDELLDGLKQYINHRPMGGHYRPVRATVDSWTNDTRVIRNIFWREIYDILIADNNRQKQMLNLARKIQNLLLHPHNRHAASPYVWANDDHHCIPWRVAVCVAMIQTYCIEYLDWIKSNWTVPQDIENKWPNLTFHDIFKSFLEIPTYTH